MEYFTDATSPTPLDHRFRQTVLKAHTTYVKDSQKAGTYSQPEHHRVALRLYQEAGYDMGSPGFREGSLKGSHQDLIPFLYLPE